MKQYWDSFEMEIQVEEVYNPLLIPEFQNPDSEDIMDRPILSLDAIKGVAGGSYCMEDDIIEAVS